MSDGTKIEWTDATWNIITGCSVVSPGCTNCYAMALAGSGRAVALHPSRVGLTKEVNGNAVWTGEVRFNDAWLLQPIHWKRPRKIFVCAHGDLFHENVPDEWIDKVFTVMSLAPQHIFQVLTKRPERMRAYMTDQSTKRCDSRGAALIELWEALETPDHNRIFEGPWPLPNVWLGTSVEDQKRADERVPQLLATPAAVRWLSCEPLLGPVDLETIYLRRDGQVPNELSRKLGDYVRPLSGNFTDSPKLDWIVVGGESGKGARPMHPDWARSIRDQCAAADVPFHFKQWGDWLGGCPDRFKASNCRALHNWGDERFSVLVGKKAAGRELDGVKHDGFPT